jgi:hypothetical protein
MKALFWITLIVLIGVVWYTINLKMEFDETTGELISCEATVDSLHELIDEQQSSYIPPVTFKEADAFKMAKAYKDHVGDDFDNVNGGIIPKQTFTEIFQNGDVNAIGYNFAMDTDALVIPSKPKGVFLVLSGVKMSRSGSDWTVNTLGSTKYGPGNWCPVYCISYTIPAEATGEAASIVTP